MDSAPAVPVACRAVSVPAVRLTGFVRAAYPVVAVDLEEAVLRLQFSAWGVPVSAD